MSKNTQCRSCQSNLVTSDCFPDNPRKGWSYQYCPKAGKPGTSCRVLSTERQ